MIGYGRPEDSHDPRREQACLLLAMTTFDLSRWFAGIVKQRPSGVDPITKGELDARVRVAVDTLPVTLFELDRTGLYTSAAGAYLALFGVSAESLLGRSIFDFPKFVPGKNMMVRRALAGATVEFTGIWPRGRYAIRLVPRFDAGGRVEAVVGLCFELGKAAAFDRQMEELLEALRESEARFRAMCDCAPLGICVSSPKLELGYVNPALCTLLDRRPEELLGGEWLNLVEAREHAALTRGVSSCEPLDNVVPYQRRDGSTVWCALRSAAMRDDGELLGYVTVVADITRERHARMVIDNAQRDLRRVIEGSPEGIAVVRDRRWIFVNRALVQTLGHPDAQALIGGEVSELVHPEDRAPLFEMLARFDELIARPQSPPASGATELRYRTASGEYVLLALRPAPLSEFEGAPAVLISARDVTEQKKLQARIAVTERLLAVGTLAAGVAHEINNPLAAALSNLSWVGDQLTRLDAARTGNGAASAIAQVAKPIEEAREACERVRAIVQDLKLLSRAEEESVGPVELTHVIDSSVRMAWNQMRHRARLVREYDDLPLVKGNEARLAQVFLNLLINATQAIPEGHANQHQVRVAASVLSAGQVAVEISDTGCGIPENVLGRIFDPFFTTKPPGVGTGLGLSICQRIVSSMDGQIEVESRVGKGTTFRVLLPAAGSEAPRAAAAPALAETSRTMPRGRVLVIDDDPAVGRALRLILAEEHEVDVLTNARQALDRLREGERYGVILCDVMMPELSGMDFHRELAQSHPELAAEIIFLTGGAFTLGAREFLDCVPNPRLSKPFKWGDLRALIGQQLTRHAQSPLSTGS